MGRRGATGTSQCYVCKWTGSSRLTHQHHVKPQQAGGKDDDNLVTLCMGCHSDVHAIGTAIQYGRSDATDMLTSRFVDVSARMRAWSLAQIAAEEFEAAKQANDQDRKHFVNVSLTHAEFSLAQGLAKDLKAGSVERLLYRLLRAELAKKHGTVEVQDSKKPAVVRSEREPTAVDHVRIKRSPLSVVIG